MHVQTLATTLRPSTTGGYRGVACHFLSYLQTNFPQILGLSELRREPHLFGWFRRLCEQNPPLSNGTRRYYLFNLRRLLYDLASAGHPLQPGWILPRISLRSVSTFPERSPQKRIDSFSKNSAAATTYSRMPYYSLAPPESASENVFISLWTAACDGWGRTNGRCMCPWVGFIPNDWFLMDAQKGEDQEVNLLKPARCELLSWHAPDSLAVSRFGGYGAYRCLPNLRVEESNKIATAAERCELPHLATSAAIASPIVSLVEREARRPPAVWGLSLGAQASAVAPVGSSAARSNAA